MNVYAYGCFTVLRVLLYGALTHINGDVCDNGAISSIPAWRCVAAFWMNWNVTSVYTIVLHMHLGSVRCWWKSSRENVCCVLRPRTDSAVNASMCATASHRHLSYRRNLQGKLSRSECSYYHQRWSPSALSLSSDRQHLSYDVCLEVRGKIIRTVLCCICTHRWAVLTVLWIGFCHTGPISLCIDLFVFICVYFVCSCFILHSCCITVSTVGWTWWDWSLILRTYLSSLLVGSFDP